VQRQENRKSRKSFPKEDDFNIKKRTFAVIKKKKKVGI
jgi:hypothetical protein